MNKLALTVTVLASLGLAACGGNTEEADTNVTNIEATTENAVEDVTVAEDAAINAADNALENAAEATNEAAAAVDNITTNAQ